MLTANELAERQIAEVKELMASGIIPITARTFSELHDYIDANCLGDADTLCDCDGPKWEQWMAINEQSQGIVDEWLRSRGGFIWTKEQIAILADAVESLAATTSDDDTEQTSPVLAIVNAMARALENATCDE